MTKKQNSMPYATSGLILGSFGALNSAIGAFYSASAARSQARSQELTLRYRQSLADINARVEQMNARQAMLAGERAVGSLTLQYAQKKGSARASLAARGIGLGEGSAAEILASTEFMKDLDVITINANAVRASEAAKMQGAAYQAESLLSGAAASGFQSQRRSVNPWLEAGTTLLSGATNVAGTWFQYRGI